VKDEKFFVLQHPQLKLFMKKILLTASLVFSLFAAHSQLDSTRLTSPSITTENNSKKSWSKLDLSNRSNDHFMIQYGGDSWATTIDSVKPSGFSRHFNAYFMLDKPFKTNPHFSVGLGAGIGSSNMFFDKTNVDIKATGTKLPFSKVDSTDHYKKFKLTTVFVEAPVELRYASNPGNSNKSFKVALGAKIGTLINAHTKGKTLQNKSGQTIGDYITKVSTKKFFNTTRLAATARIGYGILSLSGSYQITTLLKDGAGPEIRPYSIGVTISGL
jgi:hypothetical protein